uniref:EGF-like domain-containing protein n=1 Tax=Ciona intestinalis TaxID=7719 RepID=H2XM75_CIOIN
MGIQMEMFHGSCIPATQCGNFTCENLQLQIQGVGTTISSCRTSCCDGDLCNSPPPSIAPVSVHQTTMCLMSPCQNGGSCVPTRGLNGQDYSCLCRAGYSGRNCQNAAQLTCFMGTTTTMGYSGNVSMLPAACGVGENVCMMTTVVGTIDFGSPQEVMFHIGRCANSMTCGSASCALSTSMITQMNITSCNVTCCDTNYCNVAPAKPTTPSTPATTTTALSTTTLARVLQGL